MRGAFEYKNRPALRARYSVVGPKEGKGPLGQYFDRVLEDDLLGEPSWEMAESKYLREAVESCASAAGKLITDVDAVLAGDLLNQLMPSGFAARELNAPFIGLYGACSTFVEATALGGALVDGGFAENCVCAASSHFCTAERQFRFPLELGTQRPPSAQWTATACGAVLLDRERAKAAARLSRATIGRVIDFKIKDANHMGAAMAPAVADTLERHLRGAGAAFSDYDLVATGDLGWIGRDLLIELMERRGVRVAQEKLMDCGASLFSKEQDPHAGGSGCGCVASVTCAVILRRLEAGEIKRALVIGSGALLSPASQQQGESIPSVAHAIELEADG